MGWVLSYTQARRSGPCNCTETKTRIRHAGSQRTRLVRRGKDETGIPTIAGRDDPILPESPVRYKMPFSGSSQSPSPK
jgi:hypothetical protein